MESDEEFVIVESEDETTSIEGRGLIENVGYNMAGNTSLIMRGTTLEVYGSKFVMSITSGPYAAYSPQYYLSFRGKEAVFSFEEVDDMRRPVNPVFIRVEGATE